MYLDALDYAKDVAGRLGAVSPHEYLMRTNRDTKYLIEEEWPLATLGKILYHPNRLVEIDYHGPNGKPDAIIRISGSQNEIEGWNDQTPVEITAVYYKNSYLVREELARDGVSFGPTKIKRLKDGTVSSTCVGRDAGEDHRLFVPLVVDALRKKYEKVYPDNTIVLCVLFAEREPWTQEWRDIVDTVCKELRGRIRYQTHIVDTFACRHFSIRKNIPH
jgi:hypothetical protein